MRPDVSESPGGDDQVSNEKRAPGCCLGLFLWMMKYYQVFYRDDFISQYKDPYKPISIMECHVWVLNTAQMGGVNQKHLQPTTQDEG